ncbi:hypothetical protein [Paraflavitalea speifideaquila]|uniref:hypothetical protein n=1 Tax=Paraflavitalea speifideaquila TaxID=3076558 RepID=UPI0028E6348C|nr:hypothetical protein [Paraflavitalea speifideiaquila]
MKTKHYIILSLLVILIGFVYFRYYWVFAEGTKAGILNTFQKKGYIFKTYEGKIIQSGFKVNVQSNEFEFSVTSESVAKTLLENSGKDVELHYKSYFGTLPWRGMQTFIVDSVYEVRGSNGETILSPKSK